MNDNYTPGGWPEENPVNRADNDSPSLENKETVYHITGNEPEQPAGTAPSQSGNTIDWTQNAQWQNPYQPQGTAAGQETQAAVSHTAAPETAQPSSGLYNPQSYYSQGASGNTGAGPAYGAAYYNAQPKTNGRKGLSGKGIAAIVVSCVVLSSACGVGSAVMYNYLNGEAGKSIAYQSVDLDDSITSTSLGSGYSIADIVNMTADSVVEITTETVSQDSMYGNYITSGAGSGVIYTTDGYIITNNHVIEGASSITVKLRDGTEHKAEVVGSDSQTDIAVLKINATGLQAAILGDSDNLSVGDDAIVIGNPLGSLGGSVTNGIISALDREITIDGETMTLLQTNAEINPGNSGGGLFNANGELVGIVNAKSSGSEIEGLGFAIPVNTVKDVVEELVENGYVTGRPSLGVTLINITDQQTAFSYRVNELGVYVYSTSSGSLFTPGDRIVSVDGQEVTEYSEVKAIVQGHKVGDTISVVVSRDGSQTTLEVTLQEMAQS